MILNLSEIFFSQHKNSNFKKLNKIKNFKKNVVIRIKNFVEVI